MSTRISFVGHDMYLAIRNARQLGLTGYFKLDGDTIQVANSTGVSVVNTRVFVMNHNELSFKFQSHEMEGMMRVLRNVKSLVELEIDHDDYGDVFRIYSQTNINSFGVEPTEWFTEYSSFRGIADRIEEELSELVKVSGADFKYALENVVPLGKQIGNSVIEMNFSGVVIDLRATNLLTHCEVYVSTLNPEQAPHDLDGYPLSPHEMGRLIKMINKKEDVFIARRQNSTLFVHGATYFHTYDSKDEYILDLEYPEYGDPVEFSPKLVEKAIKNAEKSDPRSMASVEIMSINGDDNVSAVVHGEQGETLQIITLSEEGQVPRVSVHSGLGALLGRMSGGNAQLYVEMNKPVLVSRTTERVKVYYWLKTFQRNFM